MRRVVGILGICVAASVLWGNLLAETPEATPEAKPEIAAPPADQSTPPQTAEEIRQRLHESITIKLIKVPLDDALVEILGKRNFDYWIDAEPISESNIRLDTLEVSCDVKNVSIRALLKRILVPAHLGWVCEDAGIRITSDVGHISSHVVRIYDVAELLETPEVEVTTPAKPHQEVQFGDGGGIPADAANSTPPATSVVPGGPAASAVPNVPFLPVQARLAKMSPEQRLVIMIQEVAGGPPDAPWMDADGEGGAIHLVQTANAKLLVIRQTEMCHSEIENLLNELISHQHTDAEGAGEEVPAAKNASRSIVRPYPQKIVKRISR